jgi:protocatechuate 3,4-dioxygenase beta subunit
MTKQFLLVACLALAASCAGQPETGDSESQRTGGAIEGFVREAVTEIPIAGASIFLVRPSDQSQVRTNSDADGHFILEGMEAGRHLVAVIREGYVVPGRHEISGYPFQLATGERIAQTVFHMVPTGTIAGRVLDSDGKPANRVEVQLLQRLYLMGRSQWSEVNRGGTARPGRVATNDRGEFRALGVDPGQYVIRLVPREPSVESLTPGSASAAPTVYPGVRDISKAATVEVKAGRETLLDDIKLKNEKRSWIRVAVINESGQSLEGMGTWKVAPPDWIGSEYVLADQRVVNSYHEIQPDSPGTYDIVATWPSPMGRLAGTARVNYQGVDVNVKLSIRKPLGKLSGHVLLLERDGTKRGLVGAEVAIGPQITYFAKSGPEGALQFPEVYPGRYQLGFIRGLPADTFVLSVNQGTRDIFRENIVVESGGTNLEVVVSSGSGVLEGTVLDRSGKPAHNALVALVPESPLKDRTDYYGAYKESRTDNEGRFSIRSIIPGSYHAYAWTNAPAGAFRNGAFMKVFSGKGTPVKLDLGGQMTLELKALDGE